MLSKRDATVVKLALKRGLISDEQLAELLAAPGLEKVEEALLERGLITLEQRDDLVRALADSGERQKASGEAELARRLETAEKAQAAASGAAAAAAASGKRITAETVRLEGLDVRGFEFGPYEILEEIARGGMGVLYRARHKAGLAIGGGGAGSPAEVALKVIVKRRGGLQAAADTERFIREIRTLITLVHPNIVRIYDAGKESGLHFYTMELIRGVALKDYVRDTPIPIVMSLAIVREIALALDAMHRAGVVHRDVKPANILLDKQASPFRPVLIDFGLIKGKHAGKLTAGAGEVAGTPAYMAPEQTDGTGALGEVGPRSDLYALGAVLYYCLTRRSPFQGTKAEEVIARVRSEPPPPPTSIVPDLSRAVEAICLRCLRKDPAERYPDMRALAAALEREIARSRRSLRLENFILRARRKIFRR